MISIFYSCLAAAFCGAAGALVAAAKGRLPGDDFSILVPFLFALALLAAGLIGALASAPDIGHGLPTLVLSVIAVVAVSGYIGGDDD